MDNIIDSIREYRKKYNLTLLEFSNLVGVSQSTMSLITSGKRKPTENVLEKIKEVLKTNPSTDKKESKENNKEKDDITEKAISGATIGISGKITDIKISIKANLAEDRVENFYELKDEEKDELKGMFAFESTVVIKTLVEFLKENESKINEEIKKNMKAKLNKFIGDEE